MNIEIAWVRRDGHLTHIGPDIEAIIGWTAEEAMAQPIASMVTPSTLQYLKTKYFAGPPDTIVPHLFPLDLIHRDGHVVCCRAIVVGDYDANGDLIGARGVLKCHRGQCIQNDLLTEWSRFGDEILATLGRLAEVCA